MEILEIIIITTIVIAVTAGISVMVKDQAEISF